MTRRQHDIDSLTAIAFAEFQRSGFDATSIADIAEAAGLTKAAIYHHFASKDAILAHGLNRALNALTSIATEPDARQESALASLRYCLRRVVEEELRLLPEVSLLVRLRGNSTIELDAIERRRGFDKGIAAVLRRGQASGEIRPSIDPKVATLLMMGMIAWATEWYRPDGPYDPVAVADHVVDLCLHGVTLAP